MGHRYQYVRTVVFLPDHALRDAVDPEFARWEAEQDEEPLLREIREHGRRRREEQRRLYGREHKIREAVRKAVYQRDGGVCVRCGAKFDYDDSRWCCHHVIPYPAGDESLENLAMLCSKCHEWLHDGFADTPTARGRIDKFRRWWDLTAGREVSGPIAGA